MGKNAEVRLVGQPVLGQALGMVERGMFERLVKEHKSDRYYKAFKTWTHFAGDDLVHVDRTAFIDSAAK